MVALQEGRAARCEAGESPQQRGPVLLPCQDSSSFSKHLTSPEHLLQVSAFSLVWAAGTGAGREGRGLQDGQRRRQSLAELQVMLQGATWT